MKNYYKILNEIAAVFDMDQWNIDNPFIDSIKSSILCCKTADEILEKLGKYIIFGTYIFPYNNGQEEYTCFPSAQSFIDFLQDIGIVIKDIKNEEISIHGRWSNIPIKYNPKRIIISNNYKLSEKYDEFLIFELPISYKTRKYQKYCPLSVGTYIEFKSDKNLEKNCTYFSNHSYTTTIQWLEPQSYNNRTCDYVIGPHPSDMKNPYLKNNHLTRDLINICLLILNEQNPKDGSIQKPLNKIRQ